MAKYLGNAKGQQRITISYTRGHGHGVHLSNILFAQPIVRAGGHLVNSQIVHAILASIYQTKRSIYTLVMSEQLGYAHFLFTQVGRQVELYPKPSMNSLLISGESWEVQSVNSRL